MLSNIPTVRWLKLLLVVLISYGIFKYRDSLVDAAGYASSLRIELLLAAAFAFLSLMASSLRAKHIINEVGGLISTKESFELSAVSASSIFSLVRVGSGIPLYYLKKTGTLLSHTVVYYIADRFFNIMSFLALGVVVLGKFSWVSGLLLAAGVMVTLVGLTYTRLLPDFWPFGMIKDFIEDIRKLVTWRTAVWLSFLSLSNLMIDSFAISLLSGAGLNAVLAATVLGTAAMLVSPTPAGIGIYEPVVSTQLVSAGVVGGAAIGSVLTYRLFALWVPALVGLYVLHRKL
ncbi:hypothetical protein E2P64_00560 [Candidatus Bathyarchaeota archaeon]|nr:hypothetical protein E2P64_00560 [Candidatus Bathyarchaeota archaeon]